MGYFDGFEQIADYAWLKKKEKHWDLRIGNPCVVSVYKESLDTPKDEIIKKVRDLQLKEKQRFTKEFPQVEWQSCNIFPYKPEK